MITTETRQMSFNDIQDKTKIRYIQILNRLDKPKTAKELAVELFDLGFIPSTERNYTAPRLTELENKEAKGLKGAKSTILQMADKLAGKDGILGTEDDKKKLGSKDQKKLDEAKDLQRNVNYTKLYQEQGTKIGNQTFRTGSYDGETLYMIGARKVDEQEYNLKKGLAETNQNLASQMPNNNLNNYTNPDILKKMQEK